jgi:hypothetical protein
VSFHKLSFHELSFHELPWYHSSVIKSLTI